jgi:hypothetical protein
MASTPTTMENEIRYWNEKYGYTGFHTVGGWGEIYPRHEFDMGGNPPPINLSFGDFFFWFWKFNNFKWNLSTGNHFLYINIFAKESSKSDWGSHPRPTATPPSTKYQRSNPLSQIAILKKNSIYDLYRKW